MENSYRFFANKDCKYYPCHKGIEELNCLFCFCPFYTRKECPGNPYYIETSSGLVKDCSNCCFPHRAENYDRIMEWLRNQKAAVNE
ncbi:MAG: cysteine-rich small domain-containing protein [Clostridiales bacterium]|nr:cysteine-rich small domain-containing protein [Clostridiales bacterium]